MLVMISWKTSFFAFSLLRGDSGLPDKEMFIYLVGDCVKLELVKELREIMQGLEMILRGLEVSAIGCGLGLMMIAWMFLAFWLICLQWSLVDCTISTVDADVPSLWLKFC